MLTAVVGRRDGGIFKEEEEVIGEFALTLLEALAFFVDRVELETQV